MVLLGVQVFNGRLSPPSQSQYDMAVNVHLLHTVALLAIAFMNRYLSRTYVNLMFYFFTAGIVVFSGSLYLIATQEVTNLIVGLLDYLVPLGAITLVVAWGMVLFTGMTYKHKKRAIHNQ